MLVEHLCGVENLIVPFKSPEVIHNPSYHDRNFLKLKHNKDLLKKCAQEGKYPTERLAKVMSKKGQTVDSGMKEVLDLVSELKKIQKTPTQDQLDFFWELGSATSTVGMFQNVDLMLMCELREYCTGNTKKNLLKGVEAIEFQDRVKKAYPVLLDRFSAFSNKTGMLPTHWGHFFLQLIDHTLQFYTSLPKRIPSSEYTQRKGGEVASQVFPNWPLMFERPLYHADKAKVSCA